jgi:N6-adenosine-specific RNA methylase IME4
MFSTIIADPPWPYGSTGVHLPDRSGGRNIDGRGANVSSEQRYGKMTLAEIAAMRPPATTNAHLYLWMTNAFIEEAYAVARAWGFRPVLPITWTKLRKDGGVSRKAGYYFRGATEHALFCVRGSLKLQCKEALPTAILAERLPHSVKPEEFYELVEKASPGPRLEMWARRPRDGWDRWGNEIDNTILPPPTPAYPWLRPTLARAA